MSGREGSKRAGRVAIGCNACRVRHVRCDKDMPSCLACLKAGIECVRSLQVRFRNGLDNVDDGYSFPQSQTWVELESDRNSLLFLTLFFVFYMRLIKPFPSHVL
ncbi:hypothetical protein B0T10DRAFT_38109 [Thelonectria olida]|uniref:Zn(2)-C6 fungal-type domain-containing protein n=1 Tax=Thelonectria olida TaxID=1576542 RepID=A0A9P9AM08_9HYPO|nr:hypothetical protein B0T10DRAFT_38109 [Thelonectria olida]